MERPKVNLSLAKAKVKNYLNNQDARSKNILKNVIISFSVKGGSILVGLLLVPLTINYIDPMQYGIWLTISSVVAWVSFFDIGMGNGLRNKLADAIALNQMDDAKKYVSTAYATLGAISIVILLVFWGINPYLNWHSLLNIPATVRDDINLVVLVVMAAFCVQFVVQTINVVLLAHQQPAASSLIVFIGQIGLLITIYILKLTVPGTLTNLVLALTIVPILALLVGSIVLYTTKLKVFAPSFDAVEFKYAKSILHIGGVFFIIQIGGLLLFQTDNIIITRVIGPASVTQFNVAFKLFSVLIMLFNIIIMPYWSAFTNAYAKEDFQWMKESVRKMRFIWILLSVIVIPIVCLLSGFLFKLWLGRAVTISMELSVCMALYTIGFTGMTLTCTFLNGIGKLRIQLYLYIVSCVINVPLSIFMARKAGVPGVILANTTIMLVMGTVLWIQLNKVLKNTASGVWNK